MINHISQLIITFHVSRRRHNICTSHARLCVRVSVPCHIPTLLHGPGCNLGEWYEVPSSCALQSVHGYRYYDNIAPNAKRKRVLLFALCLVVMVVI